MNEVYTLKCWKISNYPLFTWEIEYSIDPDNSNTRYLKLFFVSLQFRVRVTGFYCICISQGAILIPRFGGLL